MKKDLIIPTILISLIIISARTNAQYTYDSISFETPSSKILIDSSNNNIWQIGAPNKNFFESAYTGFKAILTDTVNTYPANDTSVFIYVISNPYTETCFTSMEFWHKFDMDSLNDMGIIDASYDGGSSWMTVSAASLGDAYFWWDDDYHETNGNYTNHELITTGKSDGWILSRFNWQWWIPVKQDTIIIPPDSLMIRFTFISDSISTNRDGWMIDDILTSSAEWQICSGIEENVRNSSISIFPNPFSIQSTLKSENPLKNSIITIFNSFGQKVRQIENVSGLSITLFRDNMPPGLYFLLLTENDLVIAKKEILIVD